MIKNIIEFNKPFTSYNDKKYIDDVFKKNKFADGFYQKKCENFIKEKINSKFIALTQNCSSALEISMILINLKKNDEVIMPSYTFTSTANAVLLRGAKPVFADVNIYDVNLKYESVIKKINKRTKAIIVVHYAGNSCDMQKFLELKKKYNLYLIEDCAHSFMGKFKNRYLGTIGDFGSFSFHETKNLVGGQCGAISINNRSFIKKAKIILDKGTDRAFINNKKKYYSWKGIGSEFRSAELPAALLYSQLTKFNKIDKKRNLISDYYKKKFLPLEKKKFFLIKSDPKNKSANHIFALIFKNLKLRDKFINFMKTKKIFCYFHYFPLHLSSFGRKFNKSIMKNTNKINNGLVRLPLYPGLKRKEISRIVNEVKNFNLIKD
jgi:dTDP-4-amino-4,6-dideoxygalactose transaminase